MSPDITNYRERCLEAKGERCVICGTDENIVVHHLDGDRSNNSLDNLIPICRPHHSKVHYDTEEFSEYTRLLPESSLLSADKRYTRNLASSEKGRQMLRSTRVAQVERFIKSMVYPHIHVSIVAFQNQLLSGDISDQEIQAIVDECVSRNEGIEWSTEKKKSITTTKLPSEH